MLGDLFDRLFARGVTTSREDVKRRLQIVLAHDRADLPPHLMEKLRQEIIEVVSRYVDIDREGMEFNLESDQRITALVANLPVRRVRDAEALNPSPQASEELDIMPADGEFPLPEIHLPEMHLEDRLTPDITNA
jgi:cell division topological specificity factor